MIFSQAKGSLGLYKGFCLLFAVVFGFSSLSELLWPGSFPVTINEQAIGPSAGLPYYSSLGLGLLIGIAALALFWWLHRRVRRVIASELGLQIMSEPIGGVAWVEVYSVKKALPNLLNGFYLVSLNDGTEFYAPIERASPTLSTLGTWYDAPTSLEQLCIKKGVWVH
ncbi:MAG: hypothetical protein EOO55_02570 [Hymenobacter sp.]|nr:MAG: hypothetical protein EOO55_02570 [Hymenobacter sp.]